MGITMTLDRRPRTSDGTAICAGCGRTIPEGETYASEAGSDGGILVQFDTCMDCMERSERSDAASWLTVIAAVLACLAAFALMVVA